MKNMKGARFTVVYKAVLGFLVPDTHEFHSERSPGVNSTYRKACTRDQFGWFRSARPARRGPGLLRTEAYGEKAGATRLRGFSLLFADHRTS
jgi:hypothetical protein